jgi:hypothetical protein
MATRYKIERPLVSEETIARVRAMARQYVLAGGSIFPKHLDEDTDQYVGNVAELLEKNGHEEFEKALAVVTDYATHEKIWSAAFEMAGENTEAAFLFGAFVALELGALSTIGAK